MPFLHNIACNNGSLTIPFVLVPNIFILFFFFSKEVEEENMESEEIFQEQLTRILTKEYLELICEFIEKGKDFTFIFDQKLILTEEHEIE